MITGDETLIFDIDGTLVDSSAFENDCYIGALRDALGNVPIDSDWSRYPHVTDAGLLTSLMEQHRVADPGRVLERARAAFGERVRHYLKDGGSCPAVPGARESIARLVEEGYRVGIATGGWGHTAAMKLDRAGFDSATLVVASCDDAMDRAGIMTACLAKLGGGAERVVYFGDGPWDMKATASLGWRFIGVGRRLRGECEEWIADFLDARWPFSPEAATRNL